MDKRIFEQLVRLSHQTLPTGGKAYLYGSQARGDNHAGSDWDVLILLNKDKLEKKDHDNISYPFWELGWRLNVMIHPIMYTFKDWKNHHNMFSQNVNKEGIELC